MHWKNLTDYKYLGAYSLEGITDEITLTIKSVKVERVTSPGGASDDCIVAHFEETNVKGVTVKPMVLNATNCKTIESVYGTGDVDEWIGKKIIVFSTTVRFQRDYVPCLRIKAEQPKEEVRYCIVCGKVISEKIYNASIAKYGFAVCSKECLDKHKASLVYLPDATSERKPLETDAQVESKTIVEPKTEEVNTQTESKDSNKEAE